MQISEILKLFGSPLKQEHCWSICYGICMTLISKRREDFISKERIKYILNLDSLIVTQRGEIEILQSEPNFQELQNDSELIFATGNLICRCLDYGLDEFEICEVIFEDDLVELIGGMVLQNNEFDEGICDTDSLSESCGSRKFQTAQYQYFQHLLDIIRYCDARLLRKSIKFPEKHYSNICKNLYIEASELKAFLRHVLHSSEEDNRVSLDDVDGPNRAKLYIKDWAKLWLNVMDELRNKTALIESSTNVERMNYHYFNVVAPEGNQSLQVEAKNKKIVERSDSLPSDVEDRILNFIRARVPIQEEVKTNSVRRNSVYAHEVINKTMQRKISIQYPLIRKISNWETSSVNNTLRSRSDVDDILVDNILEEDFLRQSSGSESSSTITRTESDSKKRVPLTKECVQELREMQQVENREINVTLQDFGILMDFNESSLNTFAERRYSVPYLSSEQKLNHKNELCLHEIDIEDHDHTATKIGCSLTEIFKIRQEITRAELQLINDQDIKESKKCFGCKKNSFSFFQRARQCAVCSKRFCLKCTEENSLIHSDLINAVPPNIHVTHGLKDISDLTRNHLHFKSVDSLSRVGKQSFLFLHSRNARAGIRLNMCLPCKTFLDSIEKEKKTTEWKV